MTLRTSLAPALVGPALALALAPAFTMALPGDAGAESLDLAAAMERARAGAREVAAARARAEAGEARLRQARGARRPDLRLQEIWMRTDSPADVFGLQLQQERFSFPAFVASDPNDPDFIENALTRLEVSLPLYTGGEIAGRIRQAGLAAEAAGERLDWSETQAALAAAEAYIRLAQAREGVALLERSLETVEAHVRLAGAYAEQGIIVRSELLRAEVERSRIEDLLREARGRAVVAAANLSFRLAAGPDEAWELESLPAPAPLAAPLQSWLAGAGTRRDLEAARRLLEAGRLEPGILRSGLRPKVGLAARLDLNDEPPIGSHGDSTAIMAVASVDLFAGGRHRAAAAAAEAEVEAAAAEIEHFEEGVRLEIRAAYERATSARDRHRTALAAQEAARETERITRERFRQGVVKTVDLLDAATARREAETRELVARADAHLEGLRLAAAAGREPESLLTGGEGTAAPPGPEETLP